MCRASKIRVGKSNVARSRDEAGMFFGSGDAEASFSKNLGSKASAEAFAFILKTIPNTKLVVEDMKTCIFLHKSR